MLDTALNMLGEYPWTSRNDIKLPAVDPYLIVPTSPFLAGPDIELLCEILEELGQKHVRYGVKPEMFPVMGEALTHTLAECLGKDFDSAAKEAWKDKYKEICSDMLKAQLK